MDLSAIISEISIPLGTGVVKVITVKQQFSKNQYFYSSLISQLRYLLLIQHRKIFDDSPSSRIKSGVYPLRLLITQQDDILFCFNIKYVLIKAVEDIINIGSSIRF